MLKSRLEKIEFTKFKENTLLSEWLPYKSTKDELIKALPDNTNIEFKGNLFRLTYEINN